MNQKKRELGQNELADAIGQKLEQLKPHATKIAFFGLAGLAAIILIGFLISSRQSNIARQWQEFYFFANQAMRTEDPRGLEAIANDFPDSDASFLALVTAGDVQLTRGSREIVRDRQQSERLWLLAKEDYQRIVEARDVDPFVKRRAMYALAYACEALGRLDEARGYYQQLVNEASDTPIGNRARDGLRRVDNAGTVAIYEAFAKWQPSSVAPGPVLPMRPDISYPADEELIGATEPVKEGQPQQHTANASTDDVPPVPPGAGDKTDATSDDKSNDTSKEQSSQKQNDG